MRVPDDSGVDIARQLRQFRFNPAKICGDDLGTRIRRHACGGAAHPHADCNAELVAQALCLCAFLEIKRICRIINRNNRTGRVPVLHFPQAEARATKSSTQRTCLCALRMKGNCL